MKRFPDIRNAATHFYNVTSLSTNLTVRTTIYLFTPALW